MSYLRGPDRSEVQLLPACLDDYVPGNAPVRFIDAFVEQLSLDKLGFTHAQPASTGRPPYHPADLIKLYVYGYLNRIRSSRRLEIEAGRNMELMWLIRFVRPDFKTIADFRRDNRKAFKGVFKEFNLLCRRLGLFGAELVAIDGSKFKASNNSRRHYTQEQLQELIAKIEARIEEYLSQIDSEDEKAQKSDEVGEKELNEKIDQLKKRKEKYGEWVQELVQKQENEKSLTDEDSRKMKGMRGYVIGYNVQVAVDAKHDLVVEEDVVQAANDLKELAPMAKAAKEELGTEKAPDFVADAGYHHADQIQECEEAGITTYVPDQPRTGGQSRDGLAVFAKESFAYHQQTDTYTCPAGQSLARMATSQTRGRELHHYYNRAACSRCELRAQCTQSPYRKISRLANEEVVERAAQRVRTRPDLVARRKEIVEHVFGTLRQWGHDTFLMRGLEKVRAEFSISCLVYNLRRVLSVVSLEKLIEAVKVKSKDALAPAI